MKTKTHIIPAKADFNGICRIARDNTRSGDFSLITDGSTVSLSEQAAFESPKQSISMSRTKFNRLLRWYLKPSLILRK